MNNKLILALIVMLLTAGNLCHAQEWNSMVPRKIVILKSTKNYKEALIFAKKASREMERELILNGLIPHPKLGLTWNKEDCEGDWGEYPCYLARGEGGATSSYISVEYSNAYEGFSQGYYIVVAFVGEPGSSEVRKALRSARKFYSDAYAKSTKVFYGCMH